MKKKTNQQKFHFKIGQKITFKSPTRWGNSKATRIINGTFKGLPTVRYGGWSAFVINANEIIEYKSTNK
jgi:hypothetical protein